MVDLSDVHVEKCFQRGGKTESKPVPWWKIVNPTQIPLFMTGMHYRFSLVLLYLYT